MTKPTDIGTNRTGIAASPIDSRRLETGAQIDAPMPTDGYLLETERLRFAREAPPVGTVLNVVSGVGKLNMDDVIKGVMPFMLAEMLLMLLPC